MLPGLRFLFAASLLAASVLVFGMGAIALLRASHQQVANLSTQPVPEPVFAQAPDTIPSLSVLRVEPAATRIAPVAADAGRLAALTSALRDAEPAPVPEQPAGVTAPQPAAPPAIAPSNAALEPEPARVDAPLAAAPTETTAFTMELLRPSTAPASPGTETTGSTPKPNVDRQAQPPLPHVRPPAANQVAALPLRATTAPKVAAARKARKIKRRYVRRKRIPLAPVSSNPLSALFGGSTRN